MSLASRSLAERGGFGFSCFTGFSPFGSTSLGVRAKAVFQRLKRFHPQFEFRGRLGVIVAVVMLMACHHLLLVRRAIRCGVTCAASKRNIAWLLDSLKVVGRTFQDVQWHSLQSHRRTRILCASGSNINDTAGPSLQTTSPPLASPEAFLTFVLYCR
jgi:hypothetical protein